MDPMQWCRDRLLARGSPLAASLHFAPQSSQEPILALRAVISEIAAVPDTVSDPDIGRKKLAWWHDALRNRAAHPAIEALVASGAADRLAPDAFDELMARVAETFESPRFEHRDHAWSHCLGLGGPAATLEATLIDPVSAKAFEWDVIGAFAYQVRLVRDLGVDARANRWMVPLDLQASYQVARHDAVSGTVGRGWDGMVRAWLDDGLRRVDRVLDGIPADSCWTQRHLMVAHALDRRLARKLAQRPGRILQGAFQAGQLGQVWAAWRAARRLSRAVGEDRG
jgi:phytoene synthase